MKILNHFKQVLKIHSHLYNAFHNYLGGMLLLIVQGKSDFIVTNLTIIHVQASIYKGQCFLSIFKKAYFKRILEDRNIVA